MNKEIDNKTILKVLYIVGFLFAFSSAIPSYIGSTFLSTFIPEKNVGVIYTFGSILAITIMVWIQPLLRKFGNYKITLGFLILNSLSLLLLTTTKSTFLVIPTFIFYFAFSIILILNLDIFIEKYSTTATTGRIRGVYLTAINIAWLISPMITGFILTNGDYWKIFATSTLLSLPIILLIFLNFKNFKDPYYKEITIIDTLKKIWKDKNIYKILIANLLLGFFYALMVIYTPIYLHQHIGFEWSVIGMIFTIMLLPFVLFEFPLGWIADRKFGEKEILSLGFIIISLSSISISFIATKSFLVWAFVLFMTRVGASMIESMSETYFFKIINAQDTNIIEFFRISRPIAYTIAPIMATIFLFFIDLKYIFIALGIIMLYGLRYSLTIKDTK